MPGAAGAPTVGSSSLSKLASLTDTEASWRREVGVLVEEFSAVRARYSGAIREIARLKDDLVAINAALEAAKCEVASTHAKVADEHVVAPGKIAECWSYPSSHPLSFCNVGSFSCSKARGRRVRSLRGVGGATAAPQHPRGPA